jgi:alpha-amylase
MNTYQLQDIVDWLCWLRHDVGFDGWRFDFSKGYAPKRVAEYINSTGPFAAIGEFWTDCEYDAAGVTQYNQVRVVLFVGNVLP